MSVRLMASQADNGPQADFNTEGASMGGLQAQLAAILQKAGQMQSMPESEQKRQVQEQMAQNPLAASQIIQ